MFSYFDRASSYRKLNQSLNDIKTGIKWNPLKQIKKLITSNPVNLNSKNKFNLFGLMAKTVKRFKIRHRKYPEKKIHYSDIYFSVCRRISGCWPPGVYRSRHRVGVRHEVQVHFRSRRRVQGTNRGHVAKAFPVGSSLRWDNRSLYSTYNLILKTQLFLSCKKYLFFSLSVTSHDFFNYLILKLLTKYPSVDIKK
jgi:hypothetical protein